MVIVGGTAAIASFFVTPAKVGVGVLAAIGFTIFAVIQQAVNRLGDWATDPVRSQKILAGMALTIIIVVVIVVIAMTMRH